jgi:hypothetical protein
MIGKLNLLLIVGPDLWHDQTGCKSGKKFATEPTDIAGVVMSGRRLFDNVILAMFELCGSGAVMYPACLCGIETVTVACDL